MVSTDSLEQFMARGAVWLVLAVIWAAACVWVERDAPRVFRRAGLFRIFLVVLGTLLFLTTCQFGLRSLAVMLPLLPLALVPYGVMREISAPPEYQLLPRQFGGILQKAAQVLPIGRLLDKLRAPGGGGFGSTAAGSTEIALLKKNGQPYDGKDAHGLDQETSRAIRSVQGILLTAIQMRATDVHMDPKAGDELQIRYRIDGILQTISTLPGAAGRAIVSAGKVLADMDIAERRRPQDGTFAALYSGRKFDVRAASGPTNFGEKMSLRLLDSDGGIVKSGLNGIGMRESTLKTLRAIIHKPDGLLIVCGPTEDRLDNLSQTAVNTAADLTFAKILRSVLRQDPDVILVGEIRDKETAEIAMESAVTGHFVFSTVHANDTATTITRLLDMGIEATRMQAAVTAVLAQRLVRVLCEKCKVPYKPAADELRKYGIPAAKVTMFYR